ncbi:MAG: hypothetical protein ACRDZY_05380, partial [Acidimicrobiales bacterium]
MSMEAGVEPGSGEGAGTRVEDPVGGPGPVSGPGDPGEASGGTGYRGCPPDELGEAIDQVHGLMCCAQGELFGLIGALEDSGAYVSDGARNVVDWLVARRGVSHQTASVWVSMARRLPALPSLGAAFQAGRLSLDQLRPAVTLARSEAGVDDWGGAPAPAPDPEDPGEGEDDPGDPEAVDAAGEALATADEHWAEAAPSSSAATLSRLARRARPPRADDAEDAHRRRRLRWWWEGVVFRLSGHLGPDQGSVVQAALSRLIDTDPCYSERLTALATPYPSRAADVLVKLCSGSLGVDPDPDRATVVVHVDAALVAGGKGLAE